MEQTQKPAGGRDVEQMATQLAELGNPHRLEAFRLLVKAGPEGLSVGEIQTYLEIPKSTLSHHILHLVTAGLVQQEREGRVLRCFANFDAMQGIIAFLADECCAGVAINRTPDNAASSGSS